MEVADKPKHHRIKYECKNVIPTEKIVERIQNNL